MSFRKLMNQNAVIKRKVTNRQAGVFREYFDEVAENIPCRITTARRDAGYGREEFDEQKQKFLPTHTIFFLPNTDIKEKDIVEVVGRKYDIKGIRNPSEMNHHIQAYARERE